jgi:hypothetical protein
VLGLDPHRYDGVKSVLDRIHLASAGEITKGQFSGGGLSGAPCYLALVTGNDAFERISTQLRHVGFLSDDGYNWEWFSDDGERIATLRRMGPGDRYPLSNGDSYPVQKSGAMVEVC